VTDIYAATSRDAGTTFSPPVRVNTTPGDSRVNGEQPPRVAVTSRGTEPSAVTVIWTARGAVRTRLLTSTSADNLRDIAFAASRDGGVSFTAPVRVSEDHWQINGCPKDGPTLGVAPHRTVHVIWPTVVTEKGGPVKALFHAMTTDGRTFTARTRLPVDGQPNHPEMAIGPDGTLMVVWEKSGNGPRRIGTAIGRPDGTDRFRFTHTAGDSEQGKYPAVVSIGAGAWLRA
jgi:hypothetical protein